MSVTITRHANRDLAEDVALVTFAMIEELAYSGPALPASSRYRPFEGIVGFCECCAAAGSALYSAFEDYDRDCWIDTLEDFATKVVQLAAAANQSPSSEVLADLADAALAEALQHGLATRGTAVEVAS